MKKSNKTNVPLTERPSLSVEQTAELYNIGKQRIKRWIKNNPSYDWYFINGRAFYIWREKFDEFVKQFRDMDEIGA